MALAPSSLAQWVSGIASSLAVIFALFRESIVGWFRKPDLKVTCYGASPWTAKFPFTVRANGAILWSGQCYYVRAKVENAGAVRAEKVQVYASKLAKFGVNGTFDNIPTFLPLNMRWANYPEDAKGAILDGISPGMGALCDIVALCDPANPYRRVPRGMPPDTTVGELQLEAVTDEALLAPGRYQLTLKIAAANAKPIDKTIEFSHTGTWLTNDDLMRQNHLSVLLR
jgi:hypothetical protein